MVMATEYLEFKKRERTSVSTFPRRALQKTATEVKKYSNTGWL